MSMGKFNNRKDANHKDIVKAFKALGFVVFDVSNLPNCCDIVVAKNGLTLCIEIKDGSQVPSRRKLTKGEKEFRDYWSKQGYWQLVSSIKDVEFINRIATLNKKRELDQ